MKMRKLIRNCFVFAILGLMVACGPTVVESIFEQPLPTETSALIGNELDIRAAPLISKTWVFGETSLKIKADSGRWIFQRSERGNPIQLSGTRSRAEIETMQNSWAKTKEIHPEAVEPQELTNANQARTLTEMPIPTVPFDLFVVKGGYLIQYQQGKLTFVTFLKLAANGNSLIPCVTFDQLKLQRQRANTDLGKRLLKDDDYYQMRFMSEPHHLANTIVPKNGSINWFEFLNEYAEGVFNEGSAKFVVAN